jgi:hypothetical protein
VATVDWFAAEAVAAPAPVRRRRPKPASNKLLQARPRTRRKQRRVTAGVLWISAFALLLAGVVAVNVAVLQANMRLDRLGQERASLRGENAALASELSAAEAGPRVASLAARKLGLVQAAGDRMSYVEIAR